MGSQDWQDYRLVFTVRDPAAGSRNGLPDNPPDVSGRTTERALHRSLPPKPPSSVDSVAGVVQLFVPISCIPPPSFHTQD